MGDGKGNVVLTGFYLCLPYAYTLGYDVAPLVEFGENVYVWGQGRAFDFDGDGNLEVVTAVNGIGIMYFPGNGDGSFAVWLLLDQTNNFFLIEEAVRLASARDMLLAMCLSHYPPRKMPWRLDFALTNQLIDKI